MKNRLTFLPFFLLLVFLLASCKKNEFEINTFYYTPEEYEVISSRLNLPQESIDYSVNFPAYYFRNSLTTNNESALLGRVLFYDKNLSSDRSKSCASCHKQELGFSDDVPFSEGIMARSTARNSLPLGAVFNFAEYYGAASANRIPFMWDNRASSVSEQSRGTFANQNEMGMEMHQVVTRVSEQPYYAPLFKKAFGGTKVDDALILQAITDFINSMGHFNSKFDDQLSRMSPNGSSASNALKPFPGFTEKENIGKELFMTNCSSCHGRIMEPAQSIASNNGLDFVSDDKGIGGVTGQQQDMGLFKVPPLRNIALTAPYMHDGRFATLEEVIDHYSTRIKPNPNLSQELKRSNGQAIQFNFSDEDKSALIAFLNTLTDESMTTNPKFADPFLK